MYGWIITEDKLTEIEGKTATIIFGKSKIGVMGPSTISDETKAKLLAGEGSKFRMKDDDNNVYYVGRLVGDADSEEGFSPLDDFGTPDAGCTSIEYLKDNGKWEVL
jgi:hypothetical protein